MTSTDPAGELFDIVDEDGTPTGVAKPRAAVHRDGDWHRAFHLWLVWRDSSGRARVLFQRRSATKDTWPGKLDVAVGGHLRAGEGLEHVVREVEEELGIQTALEQLLPVQTRRAISRTGTWYDRELQYVHVLPLPGGLPRLQPHPTELAAVCQVTVDDLTRLFEDEAPSVPALTAAIQRDGALAQWRDDTISHDDFVPAMDNYWLNGARAAAQLLSGAS